MQNILNRSKDRLKQLVDNKTDVLEKQGMKRISVENILYALAIGAGAITQAEYYDLTQPAASTIHRHQTVRNHHQE